MQSNLAASVRTRLQVSSTFSAIASQHSTGTIHDLRRTARTHIEALGFTQHNGERSLNPELKGVAGVYNQLDYFGERKAAHQALADLPDQCEFGESKAIKF